MTTVYLDTCCLSRPFDRLAQDRTRLEADAVVWVLQQVMGGAISWVASNIVAAELSRNPDVQRRQYTLELLRWATRVVAAGPSELARGDELLALGLGRLDGLHVAVAEAANVDVLLTTDRRLVALTRRPGVTRVRVRTPVEWIGEMMG